MGAQDEDWDATLNTYQGLPWAKLPCPLRAYDNPGFAPGRTQAKLSWPEFNQGVFKMSFALKLKGL
jgi:hypothetical protein